MQYQVDEPFIVASSSFVNKPAFSPHDRPDLTPLLTVFEGSSSRHQQPVELGHCRTGPTTSRTTDGPVMEEEARSSSEDPESAAWAEGRGRPGQLLSEAGPGRSFSSDRGRRRSSCWRHPLSAWHFGLRAGARRDDAPWLREVEPARGGVQHELARWAGPRAFGATAARPHGIAKQSRDVHEVNALCDQGGRCPAVAIPSDLTQRPMKLGARQRQPAKVAQK
jgi:hypothetical protein